MKLKIINPFIKDMILKENYFPIKNEEGSFVVEDKTNILHRELASDYIIIDIMNGTNLTSEGLITKSKKIEEMLSKFSTNKFTYFFQLIIFENEASKEILDIITNIQSNKLLPKQYLNVLCVNLSNKSIDKFFQAKKENDYGILNILENVISIENPEEITNHDIENIANEKAKDFVFKPKVKQPLATYVFIGINALIAGLLFLYSNISEYSYNELLQVAGGKENFLILQGEYWRFITPIFLHGDFTHLFFNCISLFFLGNNTEIIFGRTRFITICLISGLTGNIASFIFSTNLSVGASGAVFGLFGSLLFFGLERPALYKRVFGNSILIILGINLFYGFTVENIDNFAHIGGLIGGFFVTGAITYSNKVIPYLNRFAFIFITITLIVSGFYYGFNNQLNTAVSKINSFDILWENENLEIIEKESAIIFKQNINDDRVYYENFNHLLNSELSLNKLDKAVEHTKIYKLRFTGHGAYILGQIYKHQKLYKLAEEELLEAKRQSFEPDLTDKLLQELKELSKNNSN